MIDADIWGVAWAMIAAAAGASLAVAAKTLWRRALDGYYAELDASYNALAPQLDR
jgi:hypothetical protein